MATDLTLRCIEGVKSKHPSLFNQYHIKYQSMKSHFQAKPGFIPTQTSNIQIVKLQIIYETHFQRLFFYTTF